MRVKDSVIGLVSLLFGVSIFYLTLDFPSLEGGHPGPALFPRILGLLFIAFGISLIIRGIRTKGLKADIQELPSGWGPASNAICVVAVVISYILFVEELGFIITSFILITLLMSKLGVRILGSLVLSLALTIGIYILFHKMLLVPLPWGLIPW
jgi:putative tricarboxylic transport membrane protein